MYKGKRDPMLGIIVPQDCCLFFTDSNQKDWIEVFIPPEDIANIQLPWSSIAVPPNQVCFVDDIYNAVFVNSGAVLTCLYKVPNPDGSRSVSGQERAVTERILARFLQFEYYKGHFNSPYTSYNVDSLYADYVNTGMTMIEYIRLVCRK